MADSDLGLSSHHEDYVIDYLRFAKHKRAQCLKTIESSFQDLMDSRLVETTFTEDEVREMLEGLCSLLKADVDSDLIFSSHTNALLLRQLFQQAEKWHLKLQANIAEVEDKNLLDQVAQLELSRVSVSPSHPFIPRKPTQLEPMNSLGGDKLLQMEIKRLEEENKALRERLRTVEGKISDTLAERDRYKSDLSHQKQSSLHVSQSEEMETLREEISRLKVDLSRAQSQPVKSESASTSEDELAAKSQELLRVSAELEQTKKELVAKFNSTSQYQNMKKMLTSKNATISELRAKLSRYEN